MGVREGEARKLTGGFRVGQEAAPWPEGADDVSVVALRGEEEHRRPGPGAASVIPLPEDEIASEGDQGWNLVCLNKEFGRRSGRVVKKSRGIF